MGGDLFLFAGEKSGDKIGGKLLAALKKERPSLHAVGVGGKELLEAGLEPFLPLEPFEVMGFSDVLKRLPKLVPLFYRVKNQILSLNPKAVVLIDYVTFNLKLARHLRKGGYKGKIIQYVSPSVWAWGEHRKEQMTSTLDLLLTIFPFEKACFSETPLHVAYAGHPLARPFPLDHKRENSLILLFPGSRPAEIKRNFPLQLQAAKELLKIMPQAVFAVSAVDKSLLPPSPLPLTFFPPEENSLWMEKGTVALAKSGTITLELALHGCPTVVHYVLTPLNRFYARYILKVKLQRFCIVNLIAGREVFPEFIADMPTPATLASALATLAEHTPARTACLAGCREVSEALHPPATPASSYILSLLSQPLP